MSLFALTFAVPGLLAGLSLASVPLVIHLLNRQRFRSMEWAAMRWLLEAMRKNQRRVRVEQFVLLAIRTLIILLVVLAMAKPFLEAAGIPLIADTTATHNVLIFDNSMSMHYAPTDRSRWDRAKGIAQAILDDCQQGDLASVVVMGSPTVALVGDASPYLLAVSEEIDGIKPQDGVANIATAVDKVAEVLVASPAARKQVFLITDMQRSCWVGASGDDDLGELGRKLQAISAQAGFTILDVSGDASPNGAVVDFEQVDPVAAPGRPTLLRARLANFSDKPRDDLRIEFLVDGQVEATEQVSLQAGEQLSVPFVFSFRDTGDRVAEVRLPDDPLRVDDRRWRVVTVRDRLAALLIDGQPSGEPFKSECDYLRVALSPGAGEEATSLFRTETRLESDLLESRLDEWDLVVLCNVAQLTSGEVARLEEFLKRGGGLLFFLGDQVDPAAYNEALFRDGAGFFPLRLLDVAGPAPPERPPFSFDALDYAHPIVAAFEQHEQSGLLSTKVFRYLRGATSAETLAQVALAYGSGDPALVLAPYERGMVGVVTTSADLDWNSWAVSPSFLPMMQETARRLVAGRVRREAPLVGEPIGFPLPREGYDLPAEVLPPGPDANPTSIHVEQREGIGFVSYAETGRSGIYTVTVGPPLDLERPVAVNGWPEESDLTKLHAADLRSMVPGWEFNLLDQWRNDEARSSAGIQERSELHRPLLYLALSLLFLETFLAWKFSHHFD